MALYKSPKIFTGQLSPVILPFSQPTGGGSLSSMGYHASKQSDPTSELMSDNSKFSDKLEGLKGANEAINNLYQNLDQQQAFLRSKVNEVIFSETTTEEQRQKALADYHMGMNNIASKRSELYIYAESAKDDKKYYNDDLNYVTSKSKLNAPLLGFDYGSIAAGAANTDVASNGLFDNASKPLVYNDDNGRLLTVGRFMDFRRDVTATEKDGSPVKYEPILRTQSDEEYTNTLRSSLNGKDITSEMIYDENGRARNLSQISNELSGSGYVKRKVTTNLSNIQAQVNSMFEILPAEALNRAAERLLASNIAIPKGDIVVKDKVNGKDSTFEFEGSVSELAQAITYTKEKSQDPKLSDDERMFQRKVGVELAKKFNNLVKAQVVLDAKTASTGQITSSVETSIIRNTDAYNKLKQSEALGNMVEPKVLMLRTMAETKRAGANDRQTWYFGKQNIKEEIPVYRGNFDSHNVPKMVMENMIGPLKDSKGVPIFHKLSEIGVPFMTFGGRGFSPNDIPFGLGEATLEGVTTEYMVAPKMEIEGGHAKMSNNTDASYITAIYSIDKDSSKGIMLNSATVNSGKVKGAWRDDVIALNGKPYSLKKMIEVGNDPNSRKAINGVYEKDGKIYFEVQIPVYPEALMDNDTKASYLNTEKAKEIIEGYKARSVVLNDNDLNSEQLETYITPNSNPSDGTRIRPGFHFKNAGNAINLLKKIQEEPKDSIRVAGTDIYLTEEELNSEY